MPDMPAALLSSRQPAARCRHLALAAALCLCNMATALALAQPAAARAGADDDGFASQVLAEANRYRQAQQLPPLQAAPWLATLAAEHSAQMARLSGLSHAGFQDRFLGARRQTCVENLAAGFHQASRLVAAWRASASHHQNLLDGRVQDVGVASINGHVTWLACSADPAPGR